MARGDACKALAQSGAPLGLTKPRWGLCGWLKDEVPSLSSHRWALPPFWLLGRFPTPVSPVVSQWKDMIGTAFSLAIVGYVINLAMGRTLANKHGYDVDPNQVVWPPQQD